MVLSFNRKALRATGPKEHWAGRSKLHMLWRQMFHLHLQWRVTCDHLNDPHANMQSFNTPCYSIQTSQIFYVVFAFQSNKTWKTFHLCEQTQFAWNFGLVSLLIDLQLRLWTKITKFMYSHIPNFLGVLATAKKLKRLAWTWFRLGIIDN